MSIFPKRTIRGTSVTIHWNFNTASLTQIHIFPFVRIGVCDPLGNTTMLFEGNVLALPQVQHPPASREPSASPENFLNKNLPLLVLADYLSGKRTKEVLVDMLTGIQSGKHFYFTYPVPPDAPLGKYSLISEVHYEGQVKYSKTADDDFFFVEALIVTKIISEQEGTYTAYISNSSAQAVPAKMVEYFPDHQPVEADVRLMEMPPQKITPIDFRSPTTFLFYTEERECIFLFPASDPVCLRNQQLLHISKREEAQEVIYVFDPATEDAYKLSGHTKEIWNMADGLTAKSEIIHPDNQAEYNQMVQSKLIKEIQI